MSTKKINAGDTLTVGDLTDDYLGAEVAVGPVLGVTYTLKLDKVEQIGTCVALSTPERGCKGFEPHVPVTIITPPPVVQPDEPTILGQCIWIEESRELLGFVGDPGDLLPIRAMDGRWMDWGEVLRRVGDRRIIVSDPPRWPDETPEADETLPEVVENPEQWAALPLDERRKFTWVTSKGAVADPVACGGWWYRGGAIDLGDDEEGWTRFFDTDFPLTRGERVE